MFQNEKWLEWALKLQGIAQMGLYYGTGPFDLERYEQIRQIAAEMISYKTEIPEDKVKEMFCSDVGYHTPKLDTRAAIFKDNKILLVKEKSGAWSMPGGWVEADKSIMENTIKEAREEAGLLVQPERLIALYDLDKNNLKLHPFKVIKAFVLCRVIGGHFHDNSETVGSKYFGLGELPELMTDKNTEEQIALCFKASNAKHWETVFD